MRKIIITVIATFFLIAPFENAKGQRQMLVTSADFPTVNVLTGVNAKLSLGLWRFEPFVEVGQYVQFFRESMTTEAWLLEGWFGSQYLHSEQLESRYRYYSPRFASMQILNVGIRLIVTDSDRIILGFRTNKVGAGSTAFTGVGIGNEVLYRHGDSIERQRNSGVFNQFYFGYIRRESLSQRMNMEISARLMTSRPWFMSSRVMHFQHGALAVGVGLTYEVIQNLKLSIQLDYTRRYNVWGGGGGLAIDNWHPERNVVTRNLLDFSIGIHYHIPIFGVLHQQAQQRPPRQRVAPHQRALPCPPGQMRHGRSWDRPSSVFNHPSGR